MTHRYVDENELLMQLRRALDPDGRVEWFYRWLMKQRTLPKLVGVTGAAEMLGLPKARIARLREQGRMPEPLQIVGPSAPVYLHDEVRALADELNRERDERLLRRRAREGNK